MEATTIYLLKVLNYIYSKLGFRNKCSSIVTGNVTEDSVVDNIKKTWLYRYLCGFSVDYDSNSVNYFFNIHKYLLKKHTIKEFLD